MESQPPVPGPPYPGAYRHYKGGVYLVEEIIFDSSNSAGGAIVVLYKSLEHQNRTVRLIREFMENVCSDGEMSLIKHGFGVVCGNCKPRFEMMTPQEVQDYNDNWEARKGDKS